MQNLTQAQPRTWRENWFVKNILAEIPLVGSFFAKKTYHEAFHDAGKCMAALLGGTTSMMLLPPNESNNMGVKFFQMTGSMAVGMTAGKSIYNALYHCCGPKLHFQYNLIHQRTNEVLRDITHLELQAPGDRNTTLRVSP